MMEDRRGEMETRCRTDGLVLLVLAPAFGQLKLVFFIVTRDSDEDQPIDEVRPGFTGEKTSVKSGEDSGVLASLIERAAAGLRRGN